MAKVKPARPDGERPRPRIEYREVPAGQIVNDRPVYQPLVDCIAAAQEGRLVPEEREVAAEDLRIEPGHAAEPALLDQLQANFGFRLMRMHHEEHATRVMLMRRSDGSLWVYDDCAYVALAQRSDPSRPLPCLVFDDPTQ